jgi:hypothetical protein
MMAILLVIQQTDDRKMFRPLFVVVVVVELGLAEKRGACEKICSYKQLAFTPSTRRSFMT